MDFYKCLASTLGWFAGVEQHVRAVRAPARVSRGLASRARPPLKEGNLCVSTTDDGVSNTDIGVSNTDNVCPILMPVCLPLEYPADLRLALTHLSKKVPRQKSRKVVRSLPGKGHSNSHGAMMVL
jgi:hypothetical protein